MSSEVQVGLVVAVATLLAGTVPAVVSWLANRETLRHDRLAWLRDERKAAYSRFLDALEDLQDEVRQQAETCAQPSWHRERDPDGGLVRAHSGLGAANTPTLPWTWRRER